MTITNPDVKSKRLPFKLILNYPDSVSTFIHLIFEHMIIQKVKDTYIFWEQQFPMCYSSQIKTCLKFQPR